MSTIVRFSRNAGRFTLLAFVTLAASGCWFLFEDDGPAEVTRDFWNAARDGNQEMVEALSVNHMGDFDLDSDDSEIRSISVGESEIDGDEAEVETVLEGTADETDIAVEFKTALVQRDGEWFVEMEETTGRLVGAIMGELASQFGEALGEGLGEAMEEMSAGFAEGMEELSEALEEAAREMRESERERNR